MNYGHCGWYGCQKPPNGEAQPSVEANGLVEWYGGKYKLVSKIAAIQPAGWSVMLGRALWGAFGH